MKRQYFKFALVVVACVVACFSASAQEIQYNYGELRFVDAEFDDNDVDGDGFQLGGSYRVVEPVFVFANFSQLDLDRDFEITQWTAGGGYIYNLRDGVDLVGQLGYTDVELEVPAQFGGQDQSEDGIAIAGGVRGYVHEKVELRGFVNYVDLDDSDTFVELAGDYFITDRFSAGASLTLGGDVDTITIGVRGYFGQP